MDLKRQRLTHKHHPLKLCKKYGWNNKVKFGTKSSLYPKGKQPENYFKRKLFNPRNGLNFMALVNTALSD
jgi:hypothetical protein